MIKKNFTETSIFKYHDYIYINININSLYKEITVNTNNSKKNNRLLIFEKNFYGFI